MKYIDNGGLIIFDTLTYDDAHLPHIDDFINGFGSYSCFNKKDLQGFLDRLHSRFDYYKLGTFTHFISSEYGHDNIYIDNRGRTRKGTKRPHYHVLIFCDNGSIDPEFLAFLIHDCWNKGRTDNFGSFKGDRSRGYVIHNCFTKQSMNQERLIRVGNYVSKYVLKDAKFHKKVDFTIKLYVRKYYKRIDSGVIRKAFNIDVNRIRSIVSEFVLCSNGLGMYAIDNNLIDYNQLLLDGTIKMPDLKYVYKNYCLPEYYYRKLFCKLVHGHWCLNDRGKEYHSLHLKHKSDNTAKYYKDLFLNMSHEDQVKVIDLLDGRSFNDFADYLIYYRNRIAKPLNLKDIPDKQYVVNKFIDMDSDDFLENEIVPHIDYYYKEEFRTFWEFVDGFNWRYSYKLLVPVLKKRVIIEDWKQYIIDDSWFPDHYCFDDLLYVFNPYIEKSTLVGQDVYDTSSSICSQLSLFGLKCNKG